MDGLALSISLVHPCPAEAVERKVPPHSRGRVLAGVTAELAGCPEGSFCLEPNWRHPESRTQPAPLRRVVPNLGNRLKGILYWEAGTSRADDILLFGSMRMVMEAVKH
jgi:hypothetical protein